MISITIPEIELYSEETGFVTMKSRTLRLEHSLVSISKWESIFRKPFLNEEEKTDEEALYYIKCMTITQNVKDIYYRKIPRHEMLRIRNYIEEGRSATKIKNTNADKSGVKQPVTSELIYYWMVSYNIPFECQKWHLDRLLTLINICNDKNKPKKKVSKKELRRKTRDLNAKRRMMLNTKG